MRTTPWPLWTSINLATLIIITKGSSAYTDVTPMNRRTGACASYSVQSVVQSSIPQATKLKNAFWTHIPKTGTSFVTTVYRNLCSSVPEDLDLDRYGSLSHFSSPNISDALGDFIKRGMRVPGMLVEYPPSQHCASDAFVDWDKPNRGWDMHNKSHANLLHSPLVGHRRLLERHYKSGTGLTMLRDPIGRLCSAFRYRHAVGLNSTELARIQSTKSMKEYLSFPTIRSCQTKMLTSDQCAGSKSVDMNVVTLAKRNLHTAYGFVGITDFWNQSICLFHAMFGGEPTEGEFQKHRAGADYGPPPDCGDLSENDEPFDILVYNAALKLFANRLCQYGLFVPHSLRTLLTNCPNVVM